MKNKRISQGIYNEYVCGNFKKTKYKPLPHQKNTVEYFSSSREKGILLYHRLGSGKTCTSIYIADEMLSSGLIDNVFILTPGSLRGNYLEEYCEKCGLSPKNLKKFTFITYNYNVSKNLNKVDFDNNSLVIIDEVHNLIKGIVNGSKNPTAIYNKIKDSNSKVVAMSGTPVNSFYELPYLMNILRYKKFSDSDIEKMTLETFMNSSSNILKGVVSYYPGYKDSYPEVFFQEPIKIQMSDFQNSEYIPIYKNEKKNRLRKPSQVLGRTNPVEYKKQMNYYIMGRKWIRSRKASNVVYPSEYNQETILNKDELMIKKTIPDLLVKDDGWIDDANLRDNIFLSMSPKFVQIILNILDNFKGKHMVYSFYKTKSGVQLFNTLLNKCGIKSAIFSGDQSDATKKRLLKKFNSKDNDDGSKLKVILVTEAGAEGITLLTTNNIHIVESSPTEYKTGQAIGRVVRYKSHDRLPKSRRFVNVWRYWSMPLSKDIPSIDEQLFNEGTDTQELIDTLNNVLIKNNSIPY